MSKLLTITAWSVNFSYLLIYLFLLLDEWHISVRTRALLCLGAFFMGSLTLAVVPPAMHFVAAPFLYALLFLVSLRCSGIRDTRFFFVYLSALLFTTLGAAVCWALPDLLPIHPLVLRTMSDVVLIFICVRVLRPVFLPILHVVPQRWECLLLMPLVAIVAIYMLAWLFPGAKLPLFVLACLMLLAYALFFYFFYTLYRRQEGDIGSTSLLHQHQLLANFSELRRAREARARILRHDLRHYRRLLDTTLEQGDQAGTLALIANMRVLLPATWEGGETP